MQVFSLHHSVKAVSLSLRFSEQSPARTQVAYQRFQLFGDTGEKYILKDILKRVNEGTNSTNANRLNP